MTKVNNFEETKKKMLERSSDFIDYAFECGAIAFEKKLGYRYCPYPTNNWLHDIWIAGYNMAEDEPSEDSEGSIEPDDIFVISKSGRRSVSKK